MAKLIVSLPEDRGYAGTLRVENGRGRVLAGPFPVCGRADGAAARRHDNRARNPLLPFGDTPLGRYRVVGVLPGGTDWPADRFGPHGVVVLQPTAGEAALADANGRFHLLIQGGRLGRGRRLRPTNGALRLANRDQKRLIDLLRRRRDVVCECVPMSTTPASLPVAADGPCDDGDPPRGVADLVNLPVMSGVSENHGTPFGIGALRRFAPPTFHLLAEVGGGGGGGGGDGYGDTPEDLTAAASQLAIDNENEYAAQGKVTQCSKFVRDFGTAVVGQEVPELAGQVKDQAKALAESADWRALPYAQNPQSAFREAQSLANEGRLVVVAWVNPAPTATDTGHIAAVVPNLPSATSQDGLVESGKWGKLRVPYIAQAGQTVSDKIALSYGFGADKKSTLQIFVKKP